MIDQALDKKDFERVGFLSKYIKESYIQTISRKKNKDMIKKFIKNELFIF